MSGKWVMFTLGVYILAAAADKMTSALATLLPMIR